MARTERHGSRAGAWGMKPIRFSARACAGLTPSTVIVPVDAETSPAIRRSSVVLPQPDGPSSVRISPASIVRSVGASASTDPNVLETLTSSTDADTVGMVAIAVPVAHAGRVVAAAPISSSRPFGLVVGSPSIVAQA